MNLTDIKLCEDIPELTRSIRLNAKNNVDFILYYIAKNKHLFNSEVDMLKYAQKLI